MNQTAQQKTWHMEEAHTTAVRPINAQELTDAVSPITDEDGRCIECGCPILTDSRDGMNMPVHTHAPMLEEHNGTKILIQIVCVHCAYVENRPTKVCFQTPMAVVNRTSAGENQERKQVHTDDPDSLESAKAHYAFASGLSNVLPAPPPEALRRRQWRR